MKYAAATVSLEDQFPLEAQEGAIELLEWLLQAGLKVGVLSSSTRSLVLADLERLGFPVASLCRALRNWQAANAAGIDFIGVTTDLTDHAAFARAGVANIAPDMPSVRNYFIVD